MNAEQLQVIKERADKAACSPWEFRDENEGTEYFPFWVISKDGADSGEWLAEVHVGDVSDAEFIAHAREDVPALIAEVERLQADLSQSKKDCVELHNEKLGFIAENNRLRAVLIDIVSKSSYSSDTTGFYLHCIHEKARQALAGDSDAI